MKVLNLMRSQAKEHDAVRVIGSFSQNAESKTVTVKDDEFDAHAQVLKTMLEKDAIDETRYHFDESGVIGVRERFNLSNIVSNLNMYRKATRQNISLDKYLKAAGYTKPNQINESMSLQDIFNMAGFDPDHQSLKVFIETSPVAGSRDLVPELIRAHIMKDLVENNNWALLAPQRRSISQPTETIPNVNYSGSSVAMEETTEGADLPLGTVSFGRKQITVPKRGVGLVITDEVMRYVAYNILGTYLMDVNTRLANDLFTELVNILILGDNPNLTDAVGTMGVDNTANKVRYVDFLRVFIRFMRTMYRHQFFLANENEAVRLLNTEDFKPSGNNTGPRFNINLANSAMPSSATLYITDILSDYQILMMDPRYAAEYLEAEPMSVEYARNAAQGQNRYYIRMTSGFANLFQAAKLLLDGDLAYTSFGFPSYATLLK